MTASLAQVRANRDNCIRSTGPRTPAGLARSSQNALKVGLFSKVLVLPSLGETAEDLDAFRAAIVADLDPVGAVEAELAERVAGLMWRLRRVAQYEAAAMTATVGELSPHPDAIGPLTGNGVFLPVPLDAPNTYRLAHLRAQMIGSENRIASRRAAADVFAVTDDRSPVDTSTAIRVLDAAADELNWPGVPDPRLEILIAAGFKRTRVDAIKWTVRRLGRALKAAADTADRAVEEFGDAVRERLRQAVEELERVAAERRAEETRLVEILLSERQQTATARIYADDALIQRVARAESHLSRELDRALALLAERRAERVHAPTAVQSIGFVLSTDVPA